MTGERGRRRGEGRKGEGTSHFPSPSAVTGLVVEYLGNFVHTPNDVTTKPNRHLTKYGGVFNHNFIPNLLLSVPVKEF